MDSDSNSPGAGTSGVNIDHLLSSRSWRKLPICLLSASVLAVTTALGIGQLGATAEPEPPSVEEPSVGSSLQESIDSQVAADAATAKRNGVSIASLPDDGEALSTERLPDLVPVVDDNGVVGYARSVELFVELFDPSLEFLAYGIYEADGETLIGVQTPTTYIEGEAARGIATSRPAIVPEPLTPPAD